MRRLFFTLILIVVMGLSCPANAAVTYTAFTGPDGAALALGNVGLIGDGIGYGTVNTAGASSVIYKTVDGGAAWNRMGALTTTNTAEEGHLEFYFGADLIWYVTTIKSSQYAYTRGKLGVSRDEGATWIDFNDQIDSMMAASSSPRDCFARSEGLGCFVNAGSMGNIWGRTGDGGDTWTWAQNEYFFGRFLAGADQAYMAGKTEMTVPFYHLNRYDAEAGGWVNIDAAVPPDLYLGPWHVYQGAMASMLTLIDNETATYTPATYVCASADAGASFTTCFSGEEGFTLLDALAVSANVVFLAGQVVSEGETRLQIRMTFNGGAGWSTLVDEATTDTASFRSDSAGTVYAVRSQTAGAVGFWRLSMD